jgi:serine protease Do
MSTKSIVVAVLLIGLGIVFGVVLVSSFKGVDVTFAQDPPQIGSRAPAPKVNSALQALNEAFHTVARDVTPSVVYITVKSSGSRENDGTDRFFHFFGPEFRLDPQRRSPEIGAGSGVILTANGYILTNNHVVEDADNDGILVKLSDSRETKAKLIGVDKLTDLAVIKIDEDGLPVPRLGNSDEVEVGHIVFAVGNPLGLTSTMTQGIVSALGRQINIINDGQGYQIENFIQTDAAVNPGNSGGPLIDISGAVVGINTAIATTNQRYQGYSFAIPINLARKVASDIIRYKEVRRGYIGVNIVTVDAVTAKAQGMDKAKGVIVQGVNAGSAGEAAGLNPLDIILSVDGQEVNTSQQLQSVVATKEPGQTVALKIFRDGKTIEKKVTLKAREVEREVAADDSDSEEARENRTERSSAVDVDLLGLKVRSLDNRTKTRLDVERGVLVSDVEPFSVADQRDLTPGDVILNVGNKEVRDPQEFKDAISRMKAGDALMLRVKTASKLIRYVAIQIPEKRAGSK